MKITIMFTLLTLSLFVIPIVSAESFEIVPDGILNKFDNFVDCFGEEVEGKCSQFDYDKDGIIGFADAFKFIQKHSKMIKD